MKHKNLPNHITLYCIARWLSRYNILSRFLKLLEPITIFLEKKGKSYRQLEDGDWLKYLLFLTVIMHHMQTLNLVLLRKEEMISDLTQTAFSLEKKFHIFQNDLKAKAFNYFPRLKSKSLDIKDEKHN